VEVHRAHKYIDHFLEALKAGGLDAGRRDVVVKLLISEIEKLDHDPEQLDFFASRAAGARDHLDHLRQVCRMATDPTARARAEQLLLALEKVQELLESGCHQLRRRLPHGKV
jgi:hypothetical protein